MANTVNYSALAAADPFARMQNAQTWQEGNNRKSYLYDVGQQLASGDMQGAAQSAFATGDPQMINTGMQLQDISVKRGKELAAFLTEAAQRANTRERWEKVTTMASSIFGADKVAPFLDFETGRPNAMTALQQAQLDIQQNAEQRAAAEFGMKQQVFPYDMMLKRAQAQEHAVNAAAKQQAMESERAWDALLGVTPSAAPAGAPASGGGSPAPQSQSQSTIFQNMTPDQKMRFAIARKGKDNKTMQGIMDEAFTVKNIHGGLTHLAEMPKQFGRDLFEYGTGMFQGAEGGSVLNPLTALTPISRAVGSIGAWAQGLEGSPSEVRRAIAGSVESLAAVIKPLIKKPGDGTWTNDDQARLVSVVGSVAEANSVEEYNRGLEQVRKRIEMNFGLQIPPIAGVTTRKDTATGQEYVFVGGDRRTKDAWMTVEEFRKTKANRK